MNVVRGGNVRRKPFVLITSNTLQVGGAERQRVSLANGLAERGYRVVLVLLQDVGALAEHVNPTVAVVRTPWYLPRPASGGTGVVVTGTTRTELAFGLLWRTTRGLRRQRRWLVAAHTSPKPTEPTYDTVVAALMRRSDRILALSETHWAQLTKRQALHRRAPFCVPNGVARPEPLSRGARTPGHEPLRIAYVGRLVEQKGVHTAIAALSTLADLPWRFDVYGDGPYRHILEDSVPPQLVERVTFHGWTNHPRDAAAAASLLLLPSQAEALPLVLLEAMAEGTPVMATALAAVPELLTGGSGILVPDWSVSAWTTALRVVLADPSGLANIGARGQRRVLSHYTEALMLDRYEDVFRHVLTEG